VVTLALGEDALVDLHTRIRRARNKYVKLYRRGASSRVAEFSSRGVAAAGSHDSTSHRRPSRAQHKPITGDRSQPDIAGAPQTAGIDAVQGRPTSGQARQPVTGGESSSRSGRRRALAGASRLAAGIGRGTNP
jgi:hypothetical protein